MNYLYVAMGSAVGGLARYVVDTVGLLENGGGALAMLNVVASVALALAAVFAGSYLARLALGRT